MSHSSYQRVLGRLGRALGLLAILAACGSDDPLGENFRSREVRTAEVRWRAAGSSHYAFKASAACCGAGIGTTDVVVQAGRVISVRVRSNGRDLPTTSAQPIDSMFALVRRELSRDPTNLQVTYDATLGYPRTIYWGPPSFEGRNYLGADSVVILR